MSDDERTSLLETMESARDAVAAYTGIRQQFIDAGWSERMAEAMVVEILRTNTATILREAHAA